MRMSDYSLILLSASEWKVPTTFIYGFQDWMNYQGAQEARKSMKTPCEILRVPQVLPSFFFPSDTNDLYFSIHLMKLFSSYIMTAGWSLCVHRQP